MNKPFVRVLGSCDWHPTKNNDHSHYTLSDTLLIDAGAACIMNLLNNDIEPTDLKTIFFTHMHADHMMGLPALLLNWRVVMDGDLSGLTIVGPKKTVRSAFERAFDFLCRDNEKLTKAFVAMPNIVELEGDGVYETEDYMVNYTDSDHAVPGLCYVFTEKKSGKKIGFSGDTRILDKFGDFFRDVDLLLYECSYGGGPLDEKNEKSRHSSSVEVANVVIASGAKRLLLTHTYRPKREAALEVANKMLTIPVAWAEPGKIFEV